jgi:gamma-glutamyltranspeptidase / glutathione hydrolase
MIAVELSSPSSSRPRPVITGHRGAVSTAHPLATSAGQLALAMGGNAVDATIAAQAVLCVIAPSACGLGGDALALIHEPGRGVVAINGVGRSPDNPAFTSVANRGSSVTVPGIVDAWSAMHARHGRLELTSILGPAIELARGPARLASNVAKAVVEQRQRLGQGGADSWPVLGAALAGTPVRQPELADTLEEFARAGPASFYSGRLAEAMIRAIRRHGGLMSPGDLETHRTMIGQPVRIELDGVTISVQPAPTQGVLLAMVCRHLATLRTRTLDALDHSGIELALSAFEHRDDSASAASLLALDLHHDPLKASRRRGPRAYLHTAGVAASDSSGQVVSSLVSVFDDFGSCIFVPEGGFTLNNRAEGFTEGPNRPRPAAYPIHTLAPAMVETDGLIIGLATPGADGQIQTLAQVLSRMLLLAEPLAAALDAPRWRSEDGRLLIEHDHPSRDMLARRGHDVVPLPAGDSRFGGVVCAGAKGNAPFAAADWRREVWPGVA